MKGVNRHAKVVQQVITKLIWVITNAICVTQGIQQHMQKDSVLYVQLVNSADKELLLAKIVNLGFTSWVLDQRYATVVLLGSTAINMLKDLQQVAKTVT